MRSSISANGLDEALDSLKQLQGNAPSRALSQALNNLAKETIDPLKSEVASVFDRPTPFTTNAFRIDYAKPSSLAAAVSVKDAKSGAKGQAPEAWFEPQVYGGQRRLKASEKFLRSIGALPSGQYTVPGPGARLDAYGNMSSGHIVQLMKGLLAARQGGKDDSKQPFFVMRRGSQAIGVAERLGGGEGSRHRFKLVLFFVKEPHYAPRFGFHELAEKVAESDGLFESYIDQALADELRRGR